MFYLKVGKLYVGGYSSVYGIPTFTGKTQAKVFQTYGEAESFALEHYIEDVFVSEN